MPDKLAIPSRDDIISNYERDYQLFNPGALVGPSTVPGVDARVMADALLPLYAEASQNGDQSALDNRTGTDLEQDAIDAGLPGRLPAVGASGSVTITASAGGAPLQYGLEIRDLNSGLRFQCLVTGTYADQSQIPIQGVDVGPSTNLPAGLVLTWTAPPPGLASTAIIVEQADGSGLSNGSDIETDAGIRARIREARAHPALAGNAGDYNNTALDTTAVAPQAVFVYPASNGPCTTSVVFTVKPSSSGGNRIPTDAEVADVRSNIIGQMPENDSLFMPQIVSDPVRLIMFVRWLKGQARWTDAVTWPVYYPDNKYIIDVTPTPTATAFTITTTNPTPLQAPNPPQVGQSIAVWDQINLVFRQKRILTVTGTNPWAITVDQSNGASDTSYAPAAGQIPSPWSESLSVLGPPILTQFDGLGPGEMVNAPYDEGGTRQKRLPLGSQAWPSAITGRLLTPIYPLGQIDNVQMAEPSLPFSPQIGTPGGTVYMLTLQELVAYPL